MLIDKNAILCYNRTDVATGPLHFKRRCKMQYLRRKVYFREIGYAPRPLMLLLISIALVFFTVIFTVSKTTGKTVPELHVERRVTTGSAVVEQEIKVQSAHLGANANDEFARLVEAEVVSCEDVVTADVSIVKHYDESVYVTGAMMLNGEAGGVWSITERSGCLWVACNRVLSPNYPDNLEEVIIQASQFDGYKPTNHYTQADYDLAVDVFERFYREQNGETAVEVGRSLPVDYLYFTGDGEHNYFTKVQDGEPYVWGSQLVSPYKY